MGVSQAPTDPNWKMGFAAPAEVGLAAVSGGLAPLAGRVTSAVTGDPEAGKAVREATTYEPRSEFARQVVGAPGAILKSANEAPKAVGAPSFSELGGKGIDTIAASPIAPSGLLQPIWNMYTPAQRAHVIKNGIGWGADILSAVGTLSGAAGAVRGATRVPRPAAELGETPRPVAAAPVPPRAGAATPEDVLAEGRAALAEPPAAPEAPAHPEVPVEHEADDTHHTFKSPNGETHVQENGNGNFKVVRSDTAPAAAGNGENTARLAAAADHAHDRGVLLISDSSVSPAVVRGYEKLGERGYKVVRDPRAAVNPETGNVTMPNGVAPGTPVFTVHPKVAAAPPAPGAPPTTSRFAHPADEGAASGPAAPETQAKRKDTLRAFSELPGASLGTVRESAITGDTGAAATDYFHSAQDTTGGAEMKTTIAGESNAVRGAVSNMAPAGTKLDVSPTANGAKGATLLRPIDTINDAFNERVQRLYTDPATRALPPGPMPRLAQLFKDIPESNLMTTEAKTLLAGIKGNLKSMNVFKNVPESELAGLTAEEANGNSLAKGLHEKGLSAVQADKLRKAVAKIYKPGNGELNTLIEHIKDALDDDVAEHSGPTALTEGREARTMQAEILQRNKKGITQLLPSRDGEPANRVTQPASAPDKILNFSPADMAHYLKSQKKAAAYFEKLGDTKIAKQIAKETAAAQATLKGHIAGRILDAGTNADGSWNQHKAHAEMQDLEPHMRALFSPDEMDRWQLINEAANHLRMDKTYKGAQVSMTNLGQRAAEGLTKVAGTAVTGAMAAHGGPIGAAAAHLGTTGIENMVKAMGRKAQLKAVRSRLVDLTE